MKDKNLKELILSIESSGLNTVKGNLISQTFELTPQPSLVEDLYGWIGTLILRGILFEVGIDEHHIFKWRPENKYIQYLILSHYSPNCMPKTFSLTEVLHKKDWVQNFRKLLACGYFVKATLGFGSGRQLNFDRTTEFKRILSDYRDDHSFQNEKWILQKRLNIIKEFRIHSFGRDILYGLTLKISGSIGLTDFDQPQEFIRSILQRLPSALIEGTLIGWDVGLTKNGKYYVIESNFTGYHPEYCAGFQTTGYVEDPPYGAQVCAWLHAYFKNKYKVSIGSIDELLMDKFPYMAEFSYYISIIKNEHVDAISRGGGRVHFIYIFLDEHTDYNIVNMITFMIIANYADSYSIISSLEVIEDAKKLFPGDNIKHINEESFFQRGFRELHELNDDVKNELLITTVETLSAGLLYLIIK